MGNHVRYATVMALKTTPSCQLCKWKIKHNEKSALDGGRTYLDHPTVDIDSEGFLLNRF